MSKAVVMFMLHLTSMLRLNVLKVTISIMLKSMGYRLVEARCIGSFIYIWLFPGESKPIRHTMVQNFKWLNLCQERSCFSLGFQSCCLCWVSFFKRILVWVSWNCNCYIVIFKLAVKVSLWSLSPSFSQVLGKMALKAILYVIFTGCQERCSIYWFSSCPSTSTKTVWVWFYAGYHGQG